MDLMTTAKEIRKQEADRRRARLGELIRLYFNDKQADFIQLTGINQGELSGLLKDKSFGSVKARGLEDKAGLAKGSLDLSEGQPFYASDYQKSGITKLPNKSQKAGIITEILKRSEPSIGAESIEANVSEERFGLEIGRNVAVVGEVQGGPDGYISIDDYPPGYGHGWVRVHTADPGAYGLKVRGDSMRPRIKSGEHIVVEPGIQSQPGDDVVVKFVDGSAVVKELLWIRDDEICLGSINNGIPPVTRPLDTVLYIHRVAAIIPRGSGMYRSD